MIILVPKKQNVKSNFIFQKKNSSEVGSAPIYSFLIDWGYNKIGAFLFEILGFFFSIFATS
jgi:hypothetical protein